MITRSIARSLVLPTMAAAALLLLPAIPAHAHTELTSTDPASGTSLAKPPNEIALAFTDKMSAEFSSLSLTVGDRKAVTLEPKTAGNEVSAVIPAAAPGSTASAEALPWTIAYRVVSADGHPVAGELRFEAPAPSPAELTGPAPAQPSSEPSTKSPSTELPADPGASNAESTDSGPGFPFALAGIGAVSLAVLLAGILRRRRPKDRSAEA